LKKIVTLLLLCTSAAFAQANTALDYDSSRQFIAHMQAKHGFDASQLESMLGKTRIREDILKAISRPAEKKPWYQYRPIFLTGSRIRGGVKFWNTHADILSRAEQEYGVPAEIIVAIIGVETRYGKHTGSYRVIDALSTLAFAYPPRSKFFTSELEHYLLMTRDEKLDPMELKGSYAGAMGQPQFISSSYRSYAIDFDQDGARDIWKNPADAIGSVANYFKRHGWTQGKPVTSKIDVSAVKDQTLLSEKNLKPKWSLSQLQAKGVGNIPENYDGELMSAMICLEEEDGKECWLGLKNFYAITRYNHSALYAMAVYQLSQEIREQREAELKNAAVD
jgi:membrane-bound lytic murein transglycosylase B